MCFVPGKMFVFIVRKSIVGGRQTSGPRSNWRSFTEMCSGSEAGSYLRRIDFVYHATLVLRVKRKKKKKGGRPRARERAREG